MKIFFRCDSSFSLGSGHLMRCLNLAALLKGEVTFICRNFSGNINSRVIQNQFKLIELFDIPSYSIETSIDEIEEVEAILKVEKPDIIVVDHYGLDHKWEQAAKNWCKKLVAIDDLSRKHNSDMIIDQNFRTFIPENYISSDCELFLGPEYTLSSKAFIEAEGRKRTYDKPQNALIFFGGSDLDNMTQRVSKIISDCFEDIQWHIVIGTQNQNLTNIQNEVANKPNIIIHLNTPYMSKLMEESDFFLGAGGTTTWERAKLGLPSIVISIAKNQEEICAELAKKEVILYLGKSSDVTDKDIIQGILKIKNDLSLRKTLSQNSYNLKVGEKLTDLVNGILASI